MRNCSLLLASLLALAACGGAAPPLPSPEPPVVRIVGPPEGATFAEGEPFLLVGEATDPVEGALFGPYLRWRVDGELLADDGETARVTLSLLGPHRITLRATNRAGLAAEASTTLRVVYGIRAPTEPGDLVITKVFPDPALVADRRGEYFEVWNPGPRTLDLQGLVVRDDGVDRFEVESPVLVVAGGTAAFGIDRDRAVNGDLRLHYDYRAFVLANHEDEIVLEWKRTVIDRIAYTADWPFAPGVAMALHEAFWDADSNDDPGAWRAALE